MHTGTICELDKGGFGLIDDDEGRLVLFNRKSVDRRTRADLTVGARVDFWEEIDDYGPRAIAVRLHETPLGTG